MNVSFCCPSCTGHLRAGAELGGRRIRCPRCRARVVVPAVPGVPVAPPPLPPLPRPAELRAPRRRPAVEPTLIEPLLEPEPVPPALSFPEPGEALIAPDSDELVPVEVVRRPRPRPRPKDRDRHEGQRLAIVIASIAAGASLMVLGAVVVLVQGSPGERARPAGASVEGPNPAPIPRMATLEISPGSPAPLPGTLIVPRSTPPAGAPARPDAPGRPLPAPAGPPRQDRPVPDERPGRATTHPEEPPPAAEAPPVAPTPRPAVEDRPVPRPKARPRVPSADGLPLVVRWKSPPRSRRLTDAPVLVYEGEPGHPIEVEVVIELVRSPRPSQGRINYRLARTGVGLWAGGGEIPADVLINLLREMQPKMGLRGTGEIHVALFAPRDGPEVSTHRLSNWLTLTIAF